MLRQRKLFLTSEWQIVVPRRAASTEGRKNHRKRTNNRSRTGSEKLVMVVRIRARGVVSVWLTGGDDGAFDAFHLYREQRYGWFKDMFYFFPDNEVSRVV